MRQNIFLSCPRDCDRGLTVVYTIFKSEKKNFNCRVISNHIGPMYIETSSIILHETLNGDLVSLFWFKAGSLGLPVRIGFTNNSLFTITPPKVTKSAVIVIIC